MSLDDKVSDSDQVYSSHGVKVIVDDRVWMIFPYKIKTRISKKSWFFYLNSFLD
jgi:hypothetical protein